ncbi:hypothetical protein AX769_16985 [Frondihabitans sp. PAMC 28766]|uniref:hypothetical protein n=1 Tax=Frondihabitans sp. PAMC 28766 TaxID=1795630 RepID=UPI00078B8F30|nr:hypothetical protein [Frondihabitans sp. PAMC 28766]AMM21526.1 hypothetical protein AX769_16985 [Frondihabitans sp. PAMC 28766]
MSNHHHKEDHVVSGRTRTRCPHHSRPLDGRGSRHLPARLRPRVDGDLLSEVPLCRGFAPIAIGFTLTLLLLLIVFPIVGALIAGFGYRALFETKKRAPAA